MISIPAQGGLHAAVPNQHPIEPNAPLPASATGNKATLIRLRDQDDVPSPSSAETGCTGGEFRVSNPATQRDSGGPNAPITRYAGQIDTLFAEINRQADPTSPEKTPIPCSAFSSTCKRKPPPSPPCSKDAPIRPPGATRFAEASCDTSPAPSASSPCPTLPARRRHRHCPAQQHEDLERHVRPQTSAQRPHQPRRHGRAAPHEPPLPRRLLRGPFKGVKFDIKMMGI
ncbi:hypothetical protein EV701_10490 [Chthoniobacter flavus]|nr:hypothetical protein EV701_10490 [Chthoniobacter flavus]